MTRRGRDTPAPSSCALAIYLPYTWSECWENGFPRTPSLELDEILCQA